MQQVNNEKTAPPFDLSTTSLHADSNFEKYLGDVAPVMHFSTTYKYGNSDGLVYSRDDQMTRRRVEQVLGCLEGGYCLTYSSGLSSVNAIIQHIKPTKIYIKLKEGYFGCHDVIYKYRETIQSYLPKDSPYAVEIIDLSELNKIDVSSVSSVVVVGNNNNEKNDLTQKQQTLVESHELMFKAKNLSLEETIKYVPKYRTLIWLETPNNPTCVLTDIEHYSKIAQVIGAYVAVDSTFATPVLQKPLALGADFVMHSCTKFLGGHSDLLAGAIICKDSEAWRYLREERTITGDDLGNLESWLLLRSLRSLEVRVTQQAKNAVELAKWFERQINNQETNCHITKVMHPSLENSTTREQYELWKKQMGGRGPAILSIELDTIENALKVVKYLKCFVFATSLGSVESLVDYRYYCDKNCSPTLLRLSIGLESVNDLIEDWKQALKQL
ncbi:hypothetical protein ABK040_015856 [Willaertia magna]